MLFWTSAAQVAAKLETMRSAEAKLMTFARRFGGRDPLAYEMKLFDTKVPSSVLPLKYVKDEGEELVMHGIRVTSANTSEAAATATATSTPTPLVLLHGYMNGALYFYRNLVGLTHYYQNVYSLDLMGWGLSSRPSFQLRDESVETAEEFFVESLEAWRSKNKIDKMTLAGHSMGGYMSVAYCEKYPQHVDRLILLSPVGVPEHPDDEESNAARSNYSLSRRMLFSFIHHLFENGHTPGSVLRSLPEKKGQEYSRSYVEHRIPAISDPEERAAVTDYLYTNSTMPGSGEYALNRILTSRAFAKKPTINRIPHLKVSHVSFLYGGNDWMDSAGGLEVEKACQELRQNGHSSPHVEVYNVKDAGHLLMLDNWEEFNSGVVIAGGGKRALPKHAPRPVRLLPPVDHACAEEVLAEQCVPQSVEVTMA